MDRIRRKCLQMGLIVAFAAFLIAFAKPLPLPDIAPQLTAGAAKLPMVKWQETETEVTEQDPEIVTVTDPAPEEVTPIENTGKIPAAGEAPEEVAPAAGEEDYEAQPDSSELDLLYRTVQAEGYTLGYEGDAPHHRRDPESGRSTRRISHRLHLGAGTVHSDQHGGDLEGTRVSGNNRCSFNRSKGAKGRL